ncbi:MAG: hypothetical protein SWY16_03235 [Cyanobacteriota bacterium]|nr:hypothetical protein [Cyanobacteriota bacterium]
MVLLRNIQAKIARSMCFIRTFLCLLVVRVWPGKRDGLAHFNYFNAISNVPPVRGVWIAAIGIWGTENGERGTGHEVSSSPARKLTPVLRV